MTPQSFIFLYLTQILKSRTVHGTAKNRGDLISVTPYKEDKYDGMVFYTCFLDFTDSLAFVDKSDPGMSLTYSLFCH